MVTGAVNDIVRWTSDVERRHPGFTLPMIEGFAGLSSRQSLAAATLAAAAFNTTDPFADREWLAVAGDLRDDPMVAERASLLVRDIGYEPWQNVLRNPPGLAAIWNKRLVQAPSDFDRLMDLANDLSFYGPAALKPLARQFADRALALPDRSPEQLASAASLLARRFKDPETAQALMNAGGYQAKNRSINDEDDLLFAATVEHAIENGGSAMDVQVVELADVARKEAEIAEARLWNGSRDVAAAELHAKRLMEDDLSFPEVDLKALYRGGATSQLRRVGDAWLDKARNAKDDAFMAVQYFAAASDAYRFSGDGDKAIAAAREGMPLIPMALVDRQTIADAAQRRRLAGEDNGMRIAPAIALFRAGAEKEALDSGFASGLELLKYWDRPLDEFDPQWIVDDTPKWLSVVIDIVVDSDDTAFAMRVHDALAASPNSADHAELAVLAAAGKNAQQAEQHLAALLASAKDPGKHPDDEPYTLVSTVLAWKVTELLLSPSAAP